MSSRDEVLALFLAPPNAPTWEVGTNNRELDSGTKLWRYRVQQLLWRLTSARESPTHNSPTWRRNYWSCFISVLTAITMHILTGQHTSSFFFPSTGNMWSTGLLGESKRQDHTYRPHCPCGRHNKSSGLIYQIVKHTSHLLSAVSPFQ